MINARSEYHTQLAKMSFDEIFELTAGVYVHVHNRLCILRFLYPRLAFAWLFYFIFLSGWGNIS